MVEALAGPVVLITGAENGLGAAAARRLARDGAAIALVGPELAAMEKVAVEVIEAGRHGVALAADLTDPEQAEQAVDDTLEKFGRLDVLVNAAAVRLPGTALHTTIEEWDRMVAVNVSGLLHVTHAAVPYLIDAASTAPRQIADIVNVGSPDGRVARPGASAYHLTRFGLHGFTESLRQELAPERVRVCIVAAGTTVHPADVADAIAYVIGRDSRLTVSELLLR